MSELTKIYRISEGDFLNRTMEQWILVNFYIWASSRGNLSSVVFFNNTGTDQPAQSDLEPNNGTMDSGQFLYMGLVARKPVFGFFNNTVTDQPAHTRSLISAYICCSLFGKFHM